MGPDEEDVAFLVGRYRQPQPRTALALAAPQLRRAPRSTCRTGWSAMSTSSASVSHVGAVIEAASVPLSPAAAKAVARDPELLEALLTAGDDYEIVAAVPEGNTSGFEAEAQVQRRDRHPDRPHRVGTAGTRLLGQGRPRT